MKKTAMADTLSDVTGGRTGIGQIRVCTPEEVRNAQLNLATMALDHPKLTCPEQVEAELEEVLRALGIFNNNGIIMMRPSRATRGTKHVHQPKQILPKRKRGRPRKDEEKYV